MPCWTSRLMTVELDAKGIVFARLQAAAAEHGYTVTREGGKVVITGRSRLTQDEMTAKVRQSYARLTVEAGLKKFGIKTKSVYYGLEEGVGQVVRMRVGR